MRKSSVVYVYLQLAAHGWDVINFDRVLSPDKESGAFFELQIELTDMGQVMEAMQEIDMVSMPL